ncbi:MAG: sulfate transporter CysZ [Thiohalomonadaceae bacterium]
MQAPLSGFDYLLKGFGLLRRPQLWPYVLVPVSINILVFSLLLWFVSGRFSDWVMNLLPSLPEWLSWLAWLLWLVFWLGAAIFVFFSFSLIANIIAAPFNGLLAEAVENMLTGNAPPGNQRLLQVLREIPISLLEELRKLAYFLFWAIPFGLIFLLPLVNLVAPILWALFSAWILALQYLDYPLGNHGLRFASQRRLLRSQPLLGLSFGGATLLATLVPLVNLFVIPAAVAGATCLWLEQLKNVHDKSIAVDSSMTGQTKSPNE